MNLFLPTCDDSDRPGIKGAIHLATAALYVIMAAYHASATFRVHWRHWFR